MANKSQPDPRGRADRSDVRRRAWRAIMELYGALTPLLDAELQRGTEIDLATYDALLHVHEAGEDGIRMTDLARRVVLSKSGLTAAVDRLEKRGLARRVADPRDRRATRILLTELGETLFHRAAEVHVAGIEEHFVRRLSDSEAQAIVRVLERMRQEVAQEE